MRVSGRQLVALLFVGLLVIPGSAMGVVRGSPDLDVSLSEDTVTPGADRQLRFTLTNDGDLEAGSARNPSLNRAVTTARGVDVTLEAAGAPVEVTTGTRSLGQLPQGGRARVGYGIAVDEDAAPGTYTLELTAEYRYTSTIAEETGVRNHATETETFEVTLEVEDRAQFTVIDTETDLRVGSTGTVAVTMRNVGSETASDTTLTLRSQNSDVAFGESSTANRFVGDWEAGETKTVEYQATAAETAGQQRYAFAATASFEDENGVTRRAEGLSLAVTPRPAQQFTVVSTESSVAVGTTGQVSVTLRNAGSIDVSGATVSLTTESSDLAFGESQSATRFVGDWAAGETRTVEYDVTATGSADVRSYALEATVAYEDRENDPATSRPLSVGLTPDPEREFALTGTSTTLRVGDEGVVRATITNEGETAVHNAVVRLTSEHRHVSPVETEYSVGTLEPGASTTVSFPAEVSESAEPGPRQFALVVGYDGADGDRRTSDDLLTRQRIAPGSDAFALEPVDATFAPGGGGTLTVRVTNTANETVSDVSAKLFADDPVSTEDAEAFVEELAPGESTTVTFGVSTASSALAKSYPVAVDLQYTDADGDTHVSDSHQLAVEVAAPDSGDDGGGIPIVVVGAGAVGAVGIGLGGYLRFRG